MALALLGAPRLASGQTAAPDSLPPVAAPADSLPAAAPADTLPRVAPPGGARARGRDAVVESPPELEGRPIRSVLVLPHDIYDPLPHGRLRRLYRLADQLHARSRVSTVRAHLLFAPGEPWRHERARETARTLRGLEFLVPTRIEATPAGDSVDVRVETRDYWTTSPEFNIESGGGRVFGSIAFTDRNLLGFGKAVSIYYRDDPTGISRSFSASDDAVGGSRLSAHLSAGTGSAGATNQIVVGVPFYAQGTPYAYGVSWSRATSVAHLFQRGSEVASFDRRIEDTEVRWGRGFLAHGVVRRFEASFLVHDRRLGPSRLEPGAPPEFAGEEENLHLRRLAGEARLWVPRFVERFGIERLDRLEDFDVGPSLAVKLGVSPRFLGADADEGYVRGKLDLGADAGPFGFGMVHGQVSSRLRGGPRETISQLDVRWTQQPVAGQCLVLAAWGIQGTRVARDFEPVVGGLNGLRAYPVQALAGRRLWRLNAEHRWTVARDAWQLVTLGTAAFADAARAWGAGAGGSEWFNDAGVGLRLSLPHSALNQVARFDVAWPMLPSRDGRRSPVFSFGSSQAF